MSDVVEAARFNKPFQAALCRMFLEGDGIHAVVFDTQSYTYAEGALVGVRVVVLDEDLDDAQRVLRDYEP